MLILLSMLFTSLYFSGSISLSDVEADTTMTLSLFFPSIVFAYMLARGWSLKGMVRNLGLSRSALTGYNLWIGVVIFLAILLLSFIIAGISAVTNIPLPSNVNQIFGGLPIYFLIFSFLIAPIDEEILFRGFLVPRIGVLPAAILFSVLHLSYVSISELVAAFVFGIIAGYIFKRRRSLYSTILAHALVNVLAVSSLLLIHLVMI